MPLASARFGFAGGGIPEVEISYLVLAGAGGATGTFSGGSGNLGGGGGAGGYRNSYASELSGGSTSTEAKLPLVLGES